jgi:ribonuclease PH
VHDAVEWLRASGALIEASPLTDSVAAVSVGLWRGEPVLDLDYAEDSGCDTDMNVVMTGSGGIVEVQGTAEGRPFTRARSTRCSISPPPASASSRCCSGRRSARHEK